MTDHALEVFRHAMQSGLGVSGARQAVRDYLAEKDTHLSRLMFDRYVSRLADARPTWNSRPRLQKPGTGLPQTKHHRPPV
jgi:hypothetical protein